MAKPHKPSAKGKAAPPLSFQAVSTHRRPADKDKEVKDEPDDGPKGISGDSEKNMAAPRARATKGTSSTNRSAAGSSSGPAAKANGKKRARNADEAEYDEGRSARRTKRESPSDSEIEIVEDPTVESNPTKVTGAATARKDRRGKAATVSQSSPSSSPRSSSDAEEEIDMNEELDSDRETAFSDSISPAPRASQKRARNKPLPATHRAVGSGAGPSTKRTAKARVRYADNDDYHTGKATRSVVPDTNAGTADIIVNSLPTTVRTSAITTRSVGAPRASANAIATSSAVTLDSNSPRAAPSSPPLKASRSNKGKKRTRDSDDDHGPRETKRAKQSKAPSRTAPTRGRPDPVAAVPNHPVASPSPHSVSPDPPIVPPVPFDPPVPLDPIPNPYYLDVTIVDTGNHGLERFRLANAPGVSGRQTLVNALRQATHLRLRPRIPVRHPAPLFEITALEYASILRLAPKLSWIFLEDMLVIGDMNGCDYGLRRKLDVLSFSTGWRTLELHQDILCILLVPFHTVNHVYFEARDVECPIPLNVKIRGWHFPGTCGDRFPGEIERYIEAGNAADTLNFVGGPYNLDSTITGAMRSLLRTAAPHLKFLGVGTEMLKRVERDMDFDKGFFAKISLPRLTTLALHLPFKEDITSPQPSNDMLREEYPDEFQNIHRPWVTAMSFLEHLRTARAAPNLREIVPVLHGTLPDKSTTAQWWTSTRNIRLDAFNARAASILGVASRYTRSTAPSDYTKVVCVDMSHLRTDNGFPIDLNAEESWIVDYLFPHVQARKVWIGPRTLTKIQRSVGALGLPARGARPEYDLRAHLSLPNVAEHDKAEQFCAVMHCVDDGRPLKSAWESPSAVYPRWCADLWLPVVGARAVQ